MDGWRHSGDPFDINLILTGILQIVSSTKKHRAKLKRGSKISNQLQKGSVNN